MEEARSNMLCVGTECLLFLMMCSIHTNIFNAILGKREWFYPGSKIIITTRDKNLLKAQEIIPHVVFEVEEFDERETLEFFYRRAFGVAHPLDYNKELLVQCCKGFPFALVTVGSHRRGEPSGNTWRCLAKKIRKKRRWRRIMYGKIETFSVHGCGSTRHPCEIWAVLCELRGWMQSQPFVSATVCFAGQTFLYILILSLTDPDLVPHFHSSTAHVWQLNVTNSLITILITTRLLEALWSLASRFSRHYKWRVKSLSARGWIPLPLGCHMNISMALIKSVHVLIITRMTQSQWVSINNFESLWINTLILHQNFQVSF